MSSADTVSVSPAYRSERRIHPLPKRSLRDRLTPEAAESIQYPPAPSISTSLFPSLYSIRDDEPDQSSTPPRERVAEIAPRQSRRDGSVAEGGGYTTASRQGIPDRGHSLLDDGVSDSSNRKGHQSPRTEQEERSANSQTTVSAASAIDGYDSFENTNNKKKRKIPTAGDAALGGVHVGIDAGFGTTSIQSSEGQGETTSSSSAPQYGSGGYMPGLQNVPGPGRGRYGRPRNGRSPLRPLSDSNTNWLGRGGKLRSVPWTFSSAENQGIISNAIANAEKLNPPAGSENTSLLQNSLSPKRPASAQFTFTTPGPNALSWPGSDRRLNMPTPSSARQGQENWQRVAPGNQSGNAHALPSATGAAGKEAQGKSGTGGQGQQGPAPKTTRRSAAKEYAAAARQRRRETQLRNKRHPPKPEDIWICHFCEYESIFGHPPEALVRQYEIKARKQRQLEQQRKAQWERLKKGKHKGKKNSKLPTKGHDGVQDAHQPSGGHGAPMNCDFSQGTQSEEYFDDDDYEEDDYDPDEDLPPENGIEAERHERVPDHVPRVSTVPDGGGT
ncbi:hypothetical protein B0H65DRAFT_438049 [Neurospora tetraspora]|uniref:Uncharacterized protein n=1 Tax=Neurospora tetraspora TaxID=94610 RepID=A0AAE0MVQ0_9PEZI|nr:hypothetical protein B0H65DRAFT_438049 [Neurospora tetraspora]